MDLRTAQGANVLDVAELILENTGESDTFRLQKLVYYAQACHLARYQEPLFIEPIKAWVNGPVVPSLYHAHKGRRTVTSVGGHSDHLSANQAAAVDEALRFYGAHNAQWLVAQTHAEPPWQVARSGLERGAKASPVIDIEIMREYYTRVLNDPKIDEMLAGPAKAEGLTSDELRNRFPRSPSHPGPL